MAFIYPPRNLPGAAEVWGRAVEQRDNLMENEFIALKQAVENTQRATGGQLAVSSSQIDSLVQQQTELLARASVTRTIPSFSFQTAAGGSTYNNWQGTTYSVSFPDPGVTREAVVVVSLYATSGSTLGSPSFVAGATYNSSYVWRSYPINIQTPTSPPGIGPSGWTPSTFGVFALSVPPGGLFTLSLVFQGSMFGNTPVGIDVSDVKVTVTYGSPV